MIRQRVHTTCNRDCPDACAIVAEVADGRVVSLRGDKSHPVTQGFLCSRTNRFLDRQYSAERVTRPLLKRDGEFVPITPDAALDIAAERLTAIRDASGPAAILHYKSGGSMGVTKSVVELFFGRFGPVTTKSGDVCSGAGEHAQRLDFGAAESNDLFDLHHARHIINWGKNLHISNVHVLPVLRTARARGAGYVVVDPVRTQSSADADAHVQVRPGGDIALAQAVGRVLFESDRVHAGAAARCVNLDTFRELCLARSLSALCNESDASLAQVRDLADRLADGPTAILVGWGLQRRLRGASTVRMLDALGAITGNVGVRGGGVSFYFGRRTAFDAGLVGTAAPPRRFPEPLLGQCILEASDPPIRAIWVNCANPVAMLPDSAAVARAFEQTEFVVVVDSFLTDTARRADLVLPVTTLLEDDDLLGAYGHHWIGVSRPVVPPPDDVRTDLEWMQGLAARVGLADVVAGTAREWKERFLAPVAARGASIDDLERGAVRNPLAAEVPFVPGTTLATRTGKIELIAALPDRAPEAIDDDAAFPLWLLSNSTRDAQSSQWATPTAGAMPATIHPDSAAGIPDGGAARLVSPAGALDVEVRHDATQRADVVIIAKGGHLDRGWAANVLIRARTTDFGEGAAYLDTRVRLEARSPTG